MSDSLKLEYNTPVNVKEDFSAVADPTSQATSILNIENLSTSNTLLYYVNAGTFTKQGSIAPNTATPDQIVYNFNGSKLVFTNTSTRDATAKVTLKST
jgi:predicted alternative tryptophan synthase beta-subunit